MCSRGLMSTISAARGFTPAPPDSNRKKAFLCPFEFPPWNQKRKYFSEALPSAFHWPARGHVDTPKLVTADGSGIPVTG